MRREREERAKGLDERAALQAAAATSGRSVLVSGLVFQHHWAESLLGFKSIGAITSWLPLFLFVILFGLSMTTTCSSSAGSGRLTTGGYEPPTRWRTESSRPRAR
jgi:hypothetical protein